jgi:hypothetical protein
MRRRLRTLRALVQGLEALRARTLQALQVRLPQVLRRQALVVAARVAA